MKRLCGFLWVGVVFLAGLPAVGQTNRGGVGDGTFVVVAYDAPANQYRGGPGRYLTVSADARPQAQAAIDAAEAYYADTGRFAKVKFSAGKFNLGAPSTTAVAGQCHLLYYYNGSASQSFCGVTGESWTSGDLGDVAVGQIYRVSGGDDNEGNTLEANFVPLVSTVAYVTPDITLAGANWTNGTKTLTEAGAFGDAASGDKLLITAGTGVQVGVYTIDSIAGAPNSVTLTASITGGADVGDSSVITKPGFVLEDPVGEDYGLGAGDPNCTFKQMIGALTVNSPGITLEGSGIRSTVLQTKSTADCNVVIFTSVGGSSYFGPSIRHMQINGNKPDTTFDGDRNGVIVGKENYDFYWLDVSMESCAGDGLIVCEPWGSKLTGGWIEFGNGIGLVVNEGVQGMTYGLKIADNLGNSAEGADTVPTVLFRYAKRCYFNPGQVRHDADYAMRIVAGDDNTILGSPFHAQTGCTGAVALLADGGFTADRNVIVGNTFNCSSGVDGINIASYMLDTVICGNTFASTTDDPVQFGTDVSAKVSGNYNCPDIISPRTVAVTGVTHQIDGSFYDSQWLNPDGNYTLSTTPIILDGYQKGQRLRLSCNPSEANAVTLTDQDSMASSNVQLGAATRVVQALAILELEWNGTDWQEVSYQAN